MLFQHLWAKSDPYHPLWCHLLDVAAVCEALLPRFGGVENIPTSWLLYIVAMHDIGKVDAQFQNKADSLTGPLRQAGVWFPLEPMPKFRHEARSAVWLQTNLREKFGWSRSPARVISQSITGHHGNFQADAYREEENTQAQWQVWGQLRQELAELVQRVLSLEPCMVDRFADASAVGMKLSGLIVLSDWIASNPETYRYDHQSLLNSEMTPSDYWAAAQKEGRTAVHRLELDVPSSFAGFMASGSLPAFTEIWPGMPPRPIQAALESALRENLAPGLLIIEAPMGEGKTEAALYVSECWPGLGAYIALPTQATSNQMHSRYKRFLARRRPEGGAPRLVHGMAWLIDETVIEDYSRTEDGEECLLSREWFQNAKRALLASEGVGTVDQVLMAALNVKHGFLRLLGLTSKVLIIDECHAYDLFMTTLMQTLLKWCRALGVPVILLSATLSQSQKQLLADAYGGPGSLPSGPPTDQMPYPLLTFVSQEGQAFTVTVPSDPARDRTVSLQCHSGLLGEAELTARLASAEAAGGGCVCVLANTVGSAQRIFRALEGLASSETELFLFHARFRAERRQEIEMEVLSRFGKDPATGTVENLRRPRRAILVATQVVEQSLDVDFDVMLSEIAPIDLLLQRSGRLWRHERAGGRHGRIAPVLHLLLPKNHTEKIDFGGMEIKKRGKEWRGVYDRAVLLRTLALLEAKSEIDLPADFRPLIESCYGDTPFPVSSILAQWISDADTLRGDRLADSRSKALIHLVPDPSDASFRYAETKDPETEGEEGERASFFRAQTREGDDSRAVLILHPSELQNAVRRGCQDPDYWPGKTRLKELFLQKASLPTWWLLGVPAAEGYELITQGPKWLRHHLVLPMREGEWHGTDSTGQNIVIRDDATFGLERSQK